MGSMSTKAKVIVLIVAIAVFMGIGAVGYRKMEGIFNPRRRLSLKSPPRLSPVSCRRCRI